MSTDPPVGDQPQHPDDNIEDLEAPPEDAARVAGGWSVPAGSGPGGSWGPATGGTGTGGLPGIKGESLDQEYKDQIEIF